MKSILRRFNGLRCLYYFPFLSVPWLLVTPSFAQRDLAYSSATHDVGELVFGVTNGGAYGGWWGWLLDTSYTVGLSSGVHGEYPPHSQKRYFNNGGLWIGGVVDRDTLVSVAEDGWNIYGNFEFFPEEYPFGLIEYRSILEEESNAAISEQDFIAAYTDTYTSGVPGLQPDYFNSRPHRPLWLKVDQRSYQWSYDYADDFVLVSYSVRNIGKQEIHRMYVGILLDSDVAYDPGIYIPDIGAQDDITGFLIDWPSWRGCGGMDTINLAWIADNDGDPVEGAWSDSRSPWKSVRGVGGATFLKLPDPDQRVSYNWWVSNFDPSYDFGPRAQPTDMAPYRDFQTGGQGTPEGDVNKYYMLSNGELDYDSPFISQIGYGDPDWMWPPPRIVDLLRLGGDVRFLLSFGPFDVSPGEQIDFALALVAGENLHTVPRNLANLDVGNVEAYYDRLDFSNIARNATWAKWVYDNPGVDTDGDGYAGDFRVCIKDSVFQNGQWYYDVPETTYYRGDGVPDWRAAGPPPPPVVWLHPTLNGIRVRFNGQLSETTKDIFSGIVDFEGYRIYWGRDERDYSLSLVASYDRENYDKWVWEPHLYGGGAYVIQEIPFSLDDLKCLYGQGGDPCADSLFDPLFFTSGNPYVLPGFPDSVFYFTRHDANQSNLGVTTPIKKVYPNQPPPVPGEEPEADDLTEDGNLKYYEYEFTIKNLLPTVPYYVNVTAFDFGSPESGLEALETDKQLNIQYAYPYSDPEQLGHEKQPVYIYPNPWRGDAGYRNRGFEGRARENFPEFRTREIHFENLPAHCWIKIFTIDGDLVRAIRHDVDPSDPNFRHDTWDMINRNAQLVESGIYYWAVEDDAGAVEIGKLVIIM